MSKTHLIRIRQRTKDNLEPLRKLWHSDDKLTYNDVVTGLLSSCVGVYERRAMCDQWVISGDKVELQLLIKTLQQLYDDKHIE